jgi:hypothetical protein
MSLSNSNSTLLGNPMALDDVEYKKGITPAIPMQGNPTVFDDVRHKLESHLLVLVFVSRIKKLRFSCFLIFRLCLPIHALS